MKAVVLARGKGTRMQRADEGTPLSEAQRRAAESGMKAMMPLRRPFLDYVLSALADAGVRDVCLVIGPEHGIVRDYYTTEAPPMRLRVSFAIQDEARGTADAVLAAEAFAGSDPFLVLNADNYYPVAIYRGLAALDGPGLPAFSRDALLRESNFDAERVRSFAILTVAPTGDLLDVVEKPAADTFDALARGDVLVSMNIWRFDRSIFAACRAIGPSPRGELELPNAVRHAVQVLGQRFRTFRVEAGVLDVSRRGDVAEVERRLAMVMPRP